MEFVFLIIGSAVLVWVVGTFGDNMLAQGESEGGGAWVFRVFAVLFAIAIVMGLLAS